MPPQSLFISSFHSNWIDEMGSGCFHIVYVLLCFLVLGQDSWFCLNLCASQVSFARLLWKLIKRKYFCSVSIVIVLLWHNTMLFYWHYKIPFKCVFLEPQSTLLFFFSPEGRKVIYISNHCNILFIFINLFILFYLFLAALALHCCVQVFSSCGERGLLFIAVHGLLIAVASLVAEHGL